MDKSGIYAEFLARVFFIIKGYKILSKNYKTGKGTGAGEIDFIAKRNKTIVFVEVKKRKDINTAAYSILPIQQQRIINGAKAFLKKNSHYADYNMRFDAVLIKLPFTIKHIEDAWQI